MIVLTDEQRFAARRLKFMALERWHMSRKEIVPAYFNPYIRSLNA